MPVAKALPGAPCAGPPLAAVIPYVEGIVGHAIKRGMTNAIKREPNRRSAVEPAIGNLKTDLRMGRTFPIRTEADAASALLAAIGCSFARLPACLRGLWRALVTCQALLVPLVAASPRISPASAPAA